jgi:succinoglycan biosynthesis protein ExoM
VRETESPAPPRHQRVSVCVATFRRPAELGALLQSLGVLAFHKSPPPDVEVIVVDNDPAGSARAVCESAGRELAWPLRYVQEVRPGIAPARNRAVSVAGADADFVAFIDDDEVADPSWLDELLAVQAAHDADVVGGPVLPRYAPETPAWVRRSTLFERRRLPTGAGIRHAATNNALVRAGLFRELRRAFDERLALTGGEDTHFFLDAALRGYKLVWADEAVTYELVPTSRANARWILGRAYRVGITWSFCERDLSPSAWLLGVRIAKGVARIAYGALLLPPSLLSGRAALLKAMRRVCMGAGNLAGAVGAQYREYRRTDAG